MLAVILVADHFVTLLVSPCTSLQRKSLNNIIHALFLAFLSMSSDSIDKVKE